MAPIFLRITSGSESEEELESDEGEDLEVEESTWSKELTTTADIDFNQATGMAGNVDIRSLKSSKDFFQLFFTGQVWQLLVTHTNLYAEQKKGPEAKSGWKLVSAEEMKGWIALYLCMGILK